MVLGHLLLSIPKEEKRFLYPLILIISRIKNMGLAEWFKW
jgi:hypothetical protein